MSTASPSALAFSLVVTLALAAGVGMVGYRLGGGVWPFVAALVLGAAWVLRPVLARRALLRTPFAPAARAWLARHVPVYRHGTAAERRRFEALVQAFLAEQRFEQVTEAAPWTEARRLAVAAGAATMLLGRPGWSFTTRRSFLLYAEAFDQDYFGADDPDGGGVFDGMAHQQGPVIFAVQALDGAWAYDDASNVVLHELAHLLDYANTAADGVPALLDPSSTGAWQRLVRRETQRIRVGKSLLRPYAATNGAEFFAVGTEVFFEKPVPLARRHPALFDAFRAFYAYDPRPPDHRADSANPDADGDEAPEGERARP